MRIKLHTLMAGPNGVHEPGSIIDVSEETGLALIAGRAGAQIIAVPQKIAPEKTVVDPPENTAAKRRGRKAVVAPDETR